MLREFGELAAIRRKITRLQERRPERLLEYVYNTYPESTRRSAAQTRTWAG